MLRSCWRNGFAFKGMASARTAVKLNKRQQREFFMLRGNRTPAHAAVKMARLAGRAN
jgi:hypothetical protein